MGYYFNTYRQEEGDKAYNEGRYEDALGHYSEALKTLHLHAATQKSRHTDFYDALVYVLSEILSTKLLIIQREAQNTNFNALNNYWRDIPGLLYEMEITHKEHLEKSSNAFSNKEKVVKRVNLLMAKVCEEVSDELVDKFEDDELRVEILTQAIEWMKRAINFQIKTEKTPTLSSSLGYLNLLERLYKKTNDGTSLQVISEYVSNHNLLQRTIRSPLRRLELLSYVVRVALANHEDVRELTAECNTLFELVPENERDNPILEDLQSLLDIGSPEEQAVEDDTPDTMEPNDISDLLEDVSDPIPTIRLDELDASTCPVDMLLDLERLNSETPEVSTLPSAPTNMSPLTQDMEYSPSVSQPFSFQRVGQPPQRPFFAPPSQAESSEDELPHSRALQLGLEKITSHSSNPRFLANLLSLIADFFHKNKARYIQKQNAIVLAHDLYNQVFKIDPHHHRAIEKLKDIGVNHSRLIGSYRFFSNGPRSPISTVTANISEARDYFNKALEELTIQLESLLLNQPAKVRITIDELTCFIGEQLSKGAITVTPSPEIGQMLKTTFEEELKNSGRSVGNS